MKRTAGIARPQILASFTCPALLYAHQEQDNCTDRDAHPSLRLLVLLDENLCPIPSVHSIPSPYRTAVFPTPRRQFPSLALCQYHLHPSFIPRCLLMKHPSPDPKSFLLPCPHPKLIQTAGINPVVDAIVQDPAVVPN